MKVPERLDNLTIIVTLDSNDRSEMEKIAGGLISKVDYDFWQRGYSVKDAYTFSSDNGFKGRFYIRVNPKRQNGDFAIDIIDNKCAEQQEFPTLESLTAKMVDVIRNRDGLNCAYVDRSDIPGLDFLENYIVKEDMNKYILK